MLHFDFTWDLYPNGLTFDNELNVDKLGWKEGDYFKLIEDEATGAKKLVKLDELQLFIMKGIAK
jgi:hypothetical protein